MDLLYILRSILALIFIIWVANLLLGKLNQYMKGRTQSIEVIERFSVTKNSSLAIVKVVNNYYLMSFSENQNEILKEFSAAEVYEIIELKKVEEAKNPIVEENWLELSKWKEKYKKFLKRDED